MSKRRNSGEKRDKKLTPPREFPNNHMGWRNQEAELVRRAHRNLVRLRSDPRLCADLILLASEIIEDLLIAEQCAMKQGAPILPEEL